MIIDPQMLYTLIGRLIESAPSISNLLNVADPAIMQWIGKAEACVKQTGDGALILKMQANIERLGAPIPRVRIDAATDILGIMYRSLAVAELKAPAGLAGTFIPAGNQFDAFAGISKILKAASKDVLIVDPYMDATLLTDFVVTIENGPLLRLLVADKAQNASIAPAVEKWRAQYGANRPVELRLAPAKDLHDRLLLVDGKDAYTLTQSLKDIAKRSPAEIIRTDHSASMKIDAYEEIWSNARKP